MTRRILIVDDDPNLLAALKRRLGRRFDLQTALGPQEGLRMLEAEGPFAVIVSDFCMPGMDGVEFLGHARCRAPESVRIMLTGSADLPLVAGAVNDCSVFRFFMKPCEAEELGEALDAGIDRYNQTVGERRLTEMLEGVTALARTFVPDAARETRGPR